jgi:phage gp46-like protein
MSDVRLIWDNATGTADLVMSGGDLATGNDLETAVLISLFSDHVFENGDVLPSDKSKDPRGWWADTYNVDAIGSKLWQVFSRVRNQDTLNFARDTVIKALQWMIDDGVAASVACTPSFFGSGGLGLQIAITEPSGVVTPFTFAWSQES